MTTQTAKADSLNMTEWHAFLRIMLWNKNLHGRIALGLGLLIFAAIAVMGAAYALGQIVDAIQAGQTTKAWYLASIFIGLEICAILSRYLGRLNMSYVTVETAFNIRQRLFDKMARVRVDYYDTEPYGRVLTRITSDVEGIEHFFGNILVQFTIAILEIITVIIAMLLTRADLGLILAAACLPALGFSLMTRRIPRFWLKHYRAQSAATNATLGELLNNTELIRSYGLQNWASQRLRKNTKSQLSAGLKLMSVNAWIRPLTVIFCYIPMVLVLLLGAEWLIAGTITLGVVVTFIRYSERVVTPVRTISHDIQFFQEALVSLMRVASMLEQPEEDKPIKQSDVDIKANGDIEFSAVSQRYRNGPKVLDDVNLIIKAGSQVALVGKSGSGKSTAVKVLSKLYPIESGSIHISGKCLANWDQNILRSQIGYVSQEVVTFQGTLRDNLLAATPLGLDDQQAMQRLSGSGINDWIASLEHGLNTPIAEKGSNLSAGQKQLIAIGRMLIRDCQILILDEATASIDPETERNLAVVIDRLKGRTTTILIAHRLATVTGCDKIFVFENGTVVEQGTHESLLKQNGFYKKLVKEQIQVTK